MGEGYDVRRDLFALGHADEVVHGVGLDELPAPELQADGRELDDLMLRGDEAARLRVEDYDRVMAAEQLLQVHGSASFPLHRPSRKSVETFRTPARAMIALALGSWSPRS